jgi:hypothetical protein
MALKLVFDELEAAKGADLVLAIGNTGCGKSTMLSSIVYGPGHLSEVKKDIEIETKKGKKKIKKTVIDQSENLRGLNIFKVGHSQSISETFIPQFAKDDRSGLLYGDIAGLLDTGGPFMQYINCFMNHVIFKKAKTVRFLVPMSPG